MSLHCSLNFSESPLCDYKVLKNCIHHFIGEKYNPDFYKYFFLKLETGNENEILKTHSEEFLLELKNYKLYKEMCIEEEKKINQLVCQVGEEQKKFKQLTCYDVLNAHCPNVTDFVNINNSEHETIEKFNSKLYESYFIKLENNEAFTSQEIIDFVQSVKKYKEYKLNQQEKETKHFKNAENTEYVASPWKSVTIEPDFMKSEPKYNIVL